MEVLLLGSSHTGTTPTYVCLLIQVVPTNSVLGTSRHWKEKGIRRPLASTIHNIEGDCSYYFIAFLVHLRSIDQVERRASTLVYSHDETVHSSTHGDTFVGVFHPNDREFHNSHQTLCYCTNGIYFSFQINDLKHKESLCEPIEHGGDRVVYYRC